MSGTTTLDLPRTAASPAIARMIVSAHGAGLPEERMRSAILIVSELVTNACKHGTGRIRLVVNSDADGVRAEVRDDGVGAKIARLEPRPPRGGWGLQFVEKLADAWGVDSGEARVWFRVAGEPAR